MAFFLRNEVRKYKTMSKPTTAKRKSVGCKCAANVNEQLKQLNARIPSQMRLDMKRKTLSASPVFQIVLEKIDSSIRKPLPTMFCTYCPVCGKKMED